MPTTIMRPLLSVLLLSLVVQTSSAGEPVQLAAGEDTFALMQPQACVAAHGTVHLILWCERFGFFMVNYSMAG
jgi:hypothetical protein